MLYSLFDSSFTKGIAFTGLLLGFLLTCMLLKVLQTVLPRDGGRAFAVNGVLSQGKPRGAGIVFILVFSFLALFFVPISEDNNFRELFIYLIMLVAAMLSGYLDDSSKTPWGEYKKGLIDLVIAFICAFTYVNFNSSTFTILLTGTSITLPKAVFIFLAMILIWVSINVTNCSDGVDGLSGSISIATLITFYIIFSSKLHHAAYSQLTLGLLKVALKRFLKIKILTNIRTPIHDHVRKNLGWSDTQTVFRFVILQAFISFVLLFFIM